MKSKKINKQERREKFTKKKKKELDPTGRWWILIAAQNLLDLLLPDLSFLPPGFVIATGDNPTSCDLHHHLHRRPLRKLSSSESSAATQRFSHLRVSGGQWRGRPEPATSSGEVSPASSLPSGNPTDDKHLRHVLFSELDLFSDGGRSSFHGVGIADCARENPRTHLGKPSWRPTWSHSVSANFDGGQRRGNFCLGHSRPTTVPGDLIVDERRPGKHRTQQPIQEWSWVGSAPRLPGSEPGDAPDFAAVIALPSSPVRCSFATSFSVTVLGAT